MCQSIRSIRKIVSMFFTNNLVTNARKCYGLTSCKMPVDTHTFNSPILNEEKVKLLGVNLENRLNIDFHVNTLLKAASKMYHAFARCATT